jgi:hypothetical protein
MARWLSGTPKPVAQHIGPSLSNGRTLTNDPVCLDVPGANGPSVLQEMTHNYASGLIGHDVTGISVPQFKAPPARERGLSRARHGGCNSSDISTHDPDQTASSRNDIARSDD